MSSGPSAQKLKPRSGVVELRGADPQVQQDPVRPLSREDRGQLPEVGVLETEPLGELPEAQGCALQGLGVAVHAQHATVGRDRRRISTACPPRPTVPST